MRMSKIPESFIGTATVISPEMSPQAAETAIYRQYNNVCHRWPRLGKVITALTAMSMLGGGAAIIGAEPVSAEASHIYTIENTGGEGVWLHENPGLHNRHDTIRVMMDNETFIADCYENDTPIGPRNNPVWLHGTDQTGATGYFTDFYSSSRWDANNTLHDQSLPFCSELNQSNDQSTSSQKKTSTQQTGPKYTAVFYAPGDGDHVRYRGKIVEMPVPSAVYVMATEGDIHEHWTDDSQQCGTANADNFKYIRDAQITTAGAWSIGRLGFIYDLVDSQGHNQGDGINYLLLIDPGNKHEYEDNVCDKKYNQSALLAEWLSENKNNHITILAGQETEDQSHQTEGLDGKMYGHAGIQNALFPNIRNTKLSNQALVCNYGNMDHQQMFEKFRQYLSEPPIIEPGQCPTNPIDPGQGVTGWRP